MENSGLIDTSLSLAYLLAVLSTSAASLLSPSLPSENQSLIKLSYGMPPVLKSQAMQRESESNHVIHVTTLGHERYSWVLCIQLSNNSSFVYQTELIQLISLCKLNLVY